MITWIAFKAMVDAWKIKSLIRHEPKDGDGNYQSIWMQFEGVMFQVTGGLLAGSPELDDFEASYLQNPTSTWVTGKDVTRSDIAEEFAVDAGRETVKDVKLLANTFLWGGDLIVQGVSSLDGDRIRVEVVDVDGVVAPAGTVLADIIDKKFITSQRFISVGAPDGKPSFIPAGLYIRFSYTETQNVAKVADINLIAMN